MLSISDDSPSKGGRPKRRRPKLISKDQDAHFVSTQRRLKNLRQKKYRDKKKAEIIKKKEASLECWERLGGRQKKSMRIHQYELSSLKRIIAVGTCPAARGALSPLSNILSHMALA